MRAIYVVCIVLFSMTYLLLNTMDEDEIAEIAEAHGEFPSLLAYLADFFVAALLAWLLPDGINWFFRVLGRPEPLQGLNLQARIEFFLVAALVGYGFTVSRSSARYLNDTSKLIREKLPQEIARRAQLHIDRSIQESIAGILLSDTNLSSDEKIEHTNVLHSFLKNSKELPPIIQKVAPMFAIAALDKYFDDMRRLHTTGLDLPVLLNVDLMKILTKGCSSFMYIDPIIYRDVRDDWSQSWWQLLRQLKASPGIYKSYILLNAPNSQRSIEERRVEFSYVHDIQKALESHGFEVFYCDPQALKRVDPSIDFLSTAMSVVNRKEIVLNTAKQRYTDEKTLGTCVLRADDRYKRFIDTVIGFGKPISHWPKPK